MDATRLRRREGGRRAGLCAPWLYYFEVELPGEDDRVLNPVSAHPAAYVHTPSAFPMHGADEGVRHGLTGTRKDVTLDHIRNQLGFREPSVTYADRTFRVLFVLVTEDGPASDADIATMQHWRSVIERDFTIATGGRGSVKTRHSFGRRSDAPGGSDGGGGAWQML